MVVPSVRLLCLFYRTVFCTFTMYVQMSDTLFLTIIVVCINCCRIVELCCYDYLGDLDSLYVLLTTYPPKLRKIFDIVKWCCDVIINRYTI